LYRVANSIFIVTGDHHGNLSFWTSVYLLESFLQNRLIHRGCCIEWRTNWIGVAKCCWSKSFLYTRQTNSNK